MRTREGATPHDSGKNGRSVSFKDGLIKDVFVRGKGNNPEIIGSGYGAKLASNLPATVMPQPSDNLEPNQTDKVLPVFVTYL